MDIWAILGIERTTDEREIKKAYRTKLKVTRPDDDEGTFMELRKAYECALEYAEEAAYYDEDFRDDEDISEEYTENVEVIREESLLDGWREELYSFINDIKKIRDGEAMRKFLNDSIACKLEYYEQCREIMNNICVRTSDIFLSNEVWKEIDRFFSFSVDDRIISRLSNRDELRSVNRKVKLNDKIDFNAFGTGEGL